VFNSWGFEKHASKNHLKITTINHILFCFCKNFSYQNRTWFDFLIIFWKRLTTRVPLVEQELLTLPGNLSSPTRFLVGFVLLDRSLVLCVCFVDRCLSFCTFSFGHCFVCSSSIYRFWLPLWYIQTLFTWNIYRKLENSEYFWQMNGSLPFYWHHQNWT